ncbi:LysR family transcriptional regulator [Photobacterium nomapromontoriensis]|uniref:LysR family transcriptional regulator n=1 Tax=Photobacterium nomapromontoriensis TaxID=2910237 RepID=UPI003D1499B6
MMKLHLDAIAAFVLVAEKGSFTAAARKLQKSQSTVSIAVQHLEEEVGKPLFSREKKQPQLTDDGKIFFQAAKSFLDNYQDLVSIATSISAYKNKTLKIGIDPFLYSQYICTLLTSLTTSIPGLDVIMIDSPSDVLYDNIQNGTLDIAFGYLSHTKIFDIEYNTLFNSNAFWVKAPSYLINKQELRLLLIDNDSNIQKQTLSPPASIWKCNNLSTVIDLCIAGHGIALLPEEIQAPYLENGKLQRIHDDKRFFGKSCSASLLWKSSQHLSPEVKWLIDKTSTLSAPLWLSP